jgi:hypothetical protein
LKNTDLIKSQFSIPTDALQEIEEFAKSVPTYEVKSHLSLLVFLDSKSGAFYCECHISAKDIVDKMDPDAVIDPELQEEFRANRELEPDNFYFLQMVEDARKGRTFSDIVIEYNTGYKESNPLKILGGQHRMEAIKRALEEDNVDKVHGIKVYFNLNKDQRAETMRISNTNISVSSDLRDRIEEQRLEPAGMLRNFCYVTGLLKKGEDFGDKKRFAEEFNPTVRMIRSLLVNFYEGRQYKNDLDKDAVIPYLCKSGRDTDEKYVKVFAKFKPKGSFDDPELIEAAKSFAKLHDVQFKKAAIIEGTAKKQYQIKAYNLAIVTSWAYAAGALCRHPNRLKKLYSLPDLSGKEDPLNAKAMARAKHKNDSESYRGLGTREDAKERGRLLSLWLNYSNSDKPKITEQMCNAAIDTFHSNADSIAAEEKRKRAF